MDATVVGLVKGLLSRVESSPPQSPGGRVLVGVCGIPGSGKSQLARHVVAHLNAVVGSELATVVGVDGWHLTRAQLDAMPDPQLARDKRGAAWTFDAKVRCMHAYPPSTPFRH